MQTNRPADNQGYSKERSGLTISTNFQTSTSSLYSEKDVMTSYEDTYITDFALNPQKMSFGSEIDLECHDTLDSTSGDVEISTPQWKPADSSFIVSIREKQSSYMANPYYLDSHQPFINSLMRAILYDWMLEVTSEFAMKRESVYLAMNYVDRLLSVVPNVKKEEYQLVGVAALYLASKVDEIYQPKITDFVKAAANGYSAKIVKEMEKIILKHLE